MNRIDAVFDHQRPEQRHRDQHHGDRFEEDAHDEQRQHHEREHDVAAVGERHHPVRHQLGRAFRGHDEAHDGAERGQEHDQRGRACGLLERGDKPLPRDLAMDDAEE